MTDIIQIKYYVLEPMKHNISRIMLIDIRNFNLLKRILYLNAHNKWQTAHVITDE